MSGGECGWLSGGESGRLSGGECEWLSGGECGRLSGGECGQLSGGECGRLSGGESWWLSSGECGSDLTADLLTEVIQIEPDLKPINGEEFTGLSTNVEDGARLNIAANGFWGGRFASLMCASLLH